MFILGLGSNIGDRLSYLQRALSALQSLTEVKILHVSPVYRSDALVPPDAPPSWNQPYLNAAIMGDTTLDVFTLLKKIKTIEWTIGRKPEKRHWGPREIDIDILCFNDDILETDALTLPHANLLTRPFALWPLSDIAPLWQFPLAGDHCGKTAAQLVEHWGSRFSGQAPFHTKQIPHRIDTPNLVGVLNVTPDSFSDGGLFVDPEKAWQQVTKLIHAGASVIDIGAESTSPDAQPITPEVEWERLMPILMALKEKKNDGTITPKISVDTRHYQVAEKAIEIGVDWINDVSGLDDSNMITVLRNAQVDIVIMHHLAIPERRTHVLPREQNPIPAVLAWGRKRIADLEKQGIMRDRLIFDPGIGFGKMAEQSLIVLQDVKQFKSLDTRVLIAHSRKTFLSLFTDKPFAERDVETIGATLALLDQPIDYIRVHDVDHCARAIRVYKSLKK